MLVADGKRGIYHVAAGEYLSRVQANLLMTYRRLIDDLLATY